MPEHTNSLNLEPITAHFGARVRNARIQDITPARKDELNAALHQYQVLVFEGQELSTQDYTGFGRMFGQIERNLLEQFRLPEEPDIFIISNLKKDGRVIGHTDGGFVWHSDMAFAEHPAAATMLYTLEAPTTGGDTVFASNYVSFESLPETEREHYRQFDVIHSFEQLYSGRRVQPKDEERKRWPDVVHPLVRMHPVTGREGFYLGFGDVRTICGMERDESLKLIQHLTDLATREDLIYRHKWKVGDVVIWDNRGLLHAATPYDKDNDRRLVWRISVRGERPIRAQQPRNAA
jgi:taurine dioxygenase